MKRKTLISESELNSKICNSVKKILSERRGMTSGEAMEWAAQREADKKLKAELMAKRGIKPEEPVKKVVRRKKPRPLSNPLGTKMTPRAFTTYLQAVFFDQGKNIGNNNIAGKLIQQLNRALDTSNNKKGAGGCALNHRYEEGKEEEYEEFNEITRNYLNLIGEIRDYLTRDRPWEYLSEIELRLSNLQGVIYNLADDLRKTPQVKAETNFNTGNGGHYIGFRPLLFAIIKAAKEGKFEELHKQCVDVLTKDPLSYVAENKEYNMKKRISLTESDLHRIIKESVNRVLNEWQDLPKFIIKSVVVNGKDVSDEFFRRVGKSFESKYEFASYLNMFLEPYGIEAFDVDTANDFGEEGDEVYINTNSDDDIEVHGGYADLI